MTRKSILLFIFVMLVDYYVLARRPSCPMCSPKLCPKPKNCKGGTVMDFCNCCLVCAKVEGEMCGGKWMIEGRCDAKLTCVPRDRHHRSPWTNIGHCEPAACAREICGFRQECTLNRRGHPHCVCPRNCRNRPVIPVCGYSNGKQYNNDCELYRHECKSRRAITLMHGPCKKCVYKGQKYKFDDIRPGQSSCELCVCRHGVWICRMKKNCRLRSCSQDTRSGRIISPCPPGFTCKIKIPGIPEQDIPAVGQCVSVTFTKPTVKVTSKRPVSNRPARCLMQRSKGTCRNRINRWFFNSDRGRCVKFVYSGCGGNANNFVTKSSCRASCKKEKHRSRNSRICLQEKVVGPCRAAFDRWYYDPTKGKCMMFIYGGCGGNRNNFETKQECEKVCPFGRQYPTVKQATNTTTRKANGSKCEKITIPLCKNVGYNSTSFPNSLKHKTQDVAGLEVHQFFPLVKVGCSPYINEFLCSVYAPPCSADKLTSLLPCRGLCESAKRGCEELMQGLGITWPRWLECSKFPMEITKQCFNGKLHSTILPSLTTSRQISASGRISNNSVGAMFSCYCNNCQGELTKNKCMTSFGCFGSVKLRTDGQQQKSYGCLKSQFSYMLHCTPLKARFIKVKCCKYDMCNGDMFKGKQDFFTKALPADEPQPTKLPSVATVLKVTPHTAAAKSEVCFDGHSMKSYGEREEWKPNDCTVCKCRRGQPLCVATVCRHPNCRNPVRVKGLCCPKCPRNDSSFSSETDEGVHALTGRRPETILVTINKAEERGVCEEEASGELYLLGQTWKPDDCTLCDCGRDGRVSCAVQSCEGQIPDCARPVREKGQCCPVCKEKKDSDVRRLCRDSKTGSFYSTGEMWQSDECTMCKCADNKNPLAICSREKCKAVSCPKPVRVKGRCCEVCPDRVQQGCIFEGKKFLSGDFRLLADHCTLCECQGGEWRCASDRCYNARQRS